MKISFTDCDFGDDIKIDINSVVENTRLRAGAELEVIGYLTFTSEEDIFFSLKDKVLSFSDSNGKHELRIA